MNAPGDKRQPAGTAAKRVLWSGILVGALGTILTLVSYIVVREHGGGFFIFHGMIVVGLGLAWRGYARLRHIAEVEATDKESARRSA